MVLHTPGNTFSHHTLVQVKKNADRQMSGNHNKSSFGLKNFTLQGMVTASYKATFVSFKQYYGCSLLYP